MRAAQLHVRTRAGAELGDLKLTSLPLRVRPLADRMLVSRDRLEACLPISNYFNCRVGPGSASMADAKSLDHRVGGGAGTPLSLGGCSQGNISERLFKRGFMIVLLFQPSMMPRAPSL